MTPRTCHRPVAMAAAGAAAVLCLATACPVAASEGGGVPGAADTTRPGDAVTLTPAFGTAGTTVAVRVRCASAAVGGAVFSPAFVRPAALRPAPDGALVAEAAVRPGLAPGRGYVVTANCSAAESLSTTFATAGAPRAGSERSDVKPAGARSARTRPARVQPAEVRSVGTGLAAQERAAGLQPVAARTKPAGGPVDGVALAFGGGLAAAALAGYVLIARRTAARRRAGATASSRRR